MRATKKNAKNLKLAVLVENSPILSVNGHRIPQFLWVSKQIQVIGS